jgi:hypothetical protein
MEVVAILTAQSHITAAPRTVLDATYPAFRVQSDPSAYVPIWRIPSGLVAVVMS